jgi:response regulator RpfG family c-di-GMP phosphodiesterase
MTDAMAEGGTGAANAKPHQSLQRLSQQIDSAACLPLVSHEHPLGVLWVGRQRDISSGDLRVLRAIAELAGNAIHRAQLFEQTNQRLQRLGALREIDRAITSSVDLNVLLGLLLDQVCKHLQVDAADVLLLHPSMRWLECAASRGMHTHSMETRRLWLGEGIGGKVALEHRPIHLDDLHSVEEGVPGDHLDMEGFVMYSAWPLMAKGKCKGVLEVFHRKPVAVDHEWHSFFEALAGQAAIAVEAVQLFDNLERSNADLILAYESTLEGWSRALDYRDHETEGHSQRVTEGTMRLAAAMGVDEEELPHIRRGALLHDIGKMGVPDAILLKPGPLTEEEWEIMRKHPVYAFELLYPIRYLRPALDIPYAHHERWDGKGYPRGLGKERIPLAARIFAVVDVFDALTSNRPYRRALPVNEARTYIQEQAGKQFDPAVVEAFLKLYQELGEQPRRATILVVDDDDVSLELMTELLSEEYEVFVARAVEVALTLLEHTRIDLILTDQWMPHMSGLQLLESARELSPETRAILISAAADTTMLTQALRLGTVRDFIDKPWREGEILRKVAAALRD